MFGTPIRIDVPGIAKIRVRNFEELIVACSAVERFLQITRSPHDTPEGASDVTGNPQLLHSEVLGTPRYVKDAMDKIIREHEAKQVAAGS